MDIIKQLKQRDGKGRSLLACLDDYIAIDLETTGLNPCMNEIIEVGAVRVVGGEPIDEFVTLVRPSRSIPSFITGLTGITNKDVEDAPEIEEVMPALAGYLGDAVLLGHNVNFDVNFLFEQQRRLGKRLGNDFIDTLRVSRLVFRGMENYKLGTLVRCLGIPNGVSHRASDDCVAAHLIYEKAKAFAAEHNIGFALDEK